MHRDAESQTPPRGTRHTRPAQTTPRQFEALLSVDFGFVLTQSFTFLGRAAATVEDAIEAMRNALDGFEVEGIGHNLPFCSAVMDHARFVSGNITTAFIAEEYPDGFTGAPASEDLIRKLCAIAGVVATSTSERARHIDGQLGDNLVVGDNIEWQGLIWTVAEMEEGEPRKIGVRFQEEDPV